MRTGSGELVKMTKQQIKDDIQEGVREAASRGHIPQISGSEIDQILEIMTAPTTTVGIEPGKEIVLSTDGSYMKFTSIGRYAGVPMSKEQAVWVAERVLGFDTMDLGTSDYSFKPVKSIAMDEAHQLENCQLLSVVPLFYGAMPNLGVYYQSLGGKWPSPVDLMKQGKLADAKTVQENAAQDLTRDIVYVGRIMHRAGADGLNLDTTAAAGDAEFYASLQAIETVTKETGMAVEVGMAGEMIQGMHTGLRYRGTRLAGLWPHEQGKLIEDAGASIFGPSINTRIGKSFPWNVGFSVTFVKQCVEQVSIPIHVNMGMGVCGIPMVETVPVECASRAAKAMIDVANVDGI
jgi:dimethylamine--corrinoid protein Co-methyltransferase